VTGVPLSYFIFIVIQLLTIAVPARAESAASTALHTLAPALLGIVGGRKAEKGDFISTVKITLALPDGKIKNCTGFIIEGCVVTAAHCASLLKGASHTISVGHNPKASTTDVSQVAMWGDGNTPEFDIAVLVPQAPPPASLAGSRDDIATEPPKRGDLMQVAGYGLSETEKAPDGTRRNTGSGSKLWGQVRVTNFSTDGSDDLESGPLIVSERAPQIIAPGDSGGYAVINGKIQGIATVVKPEYALREGEEAPKEELLVDNITRGYHISLARPKARKWLFDTLDKLDCAGGTREAVMKETRDLVRDNFNKYRLRTDWVNRSVPEMDVVNSLKAKLRRLMNLSPSEPLFIEPISYGNYAFEFTYHRGPKDRPAETGLFKVELDTGKVVVTADTSVPITLPPPKLKDRSLLTEPVFRIPKPGPP